MAISDYQLLIKRGFSKTFLKSPPGHLPYLHKIFLTEHPSSYMCTQCACNYVRVDEIDFPVLDERGKEVRLEITPAQAAGFCSSECSGELALEQGAENVEIAAMIALRPDFYESREWREIRMDAILKYGRTCQCCGVAPAEKHRIHVDHVKPRYHYPYLALTLSNLQILCDDCNIGKGARYETDWREATS